ncbi:MAG: 23S rRNA (uracil(1939)-C(5))-methyltransferase RlmD [Planctomycetota bacterium]|nr:23S rRNA (uracil(1939)-C(5))-methyltransferase RlmD [Planctomycetota bacterium]
MSSGDELADGGADDFELDASSAPGGIAEGAFGSGTEPIAGGAVTTERKPRQGDEFTLTIDAFDARGHGLARSGPYRFRVQRAAVGSTVRARVLRRRRDEVEAVAFDVVEGGPHAVRPECAHFRACGGCSFQDLAYAEQLAGKKRLVESALHARGLLAHGIAVEEVVPAPRIWRYRNKMEFTFSNRRWIAPAEPEGVDASFALGMHALGLYSKVVDVRACPIQSEIADAVVAASRAIAVERGLSAWDLKLHAGLLRHLVIRRAERTGEVLVNLVTSADAPELVEPFARELAARVPGITTIVQTVNSRAATTAIGERERTLLGPGTITEELCGLRFSISAGSFFQTNTLAAEGLFEAVRQEAALGPDGVAWDLYCGTGTISLVLARGARAVVGFELVASAIRDARANAERNGIANARFVEGDVLTGLSATSGLPVPDVLVLDPPRAGLHPRVVPSLAAVPARRIVYVSCNPAAAAVDVAAFAAIGWRLARVRPFDQFPHTPHVETVLTLERAP